MNGQALSAWNERVHAACGRFDTRYDHCQSLFIGEMQQTLMGSTAVAHIRSNASVIAKAARSASVIPGALFPCAATARLNGHRTGGPGGRPAPG